MTYSRFLLRPSLRIYTQQDAKQDAKPAKPWNATSANTGPWAQGHGVTNPPAPTDNAWRDRLVSELAGVAPRRAAGALQTDSIRTVNSTSRHDPAIGIWTPQEPTLDAVFQTKE